jgi:hypothetical protein
LPDGDGAVGLVWRTDKGELGSGLTTGTRVFDSDGGLRRLNESAKDGKKILDKGETVNPGADGVIAWGRWTDGESKVNDATGNGKGKVQTLHYFALAGPAALPVAGVFTSFASTAPTIASGRQLVATGQLDSASGTVNLVFLSATGGSASYNLSVPVPGQTFTLTGRAAQTSNFGFAGVSTIVSTGSGCDGGCTGTLGSGYSVKGLVGGAQGDRLGLTYGFDSRIGNVSGVIVFKR